MIALVMAGGKGTRMKTLKEKLLLKYKQPIILHVISALIDSKLFSKILVGTSSHSPKTKKLLENFEVDIVETLGNGYVVDMNEILQNLQDDVFVISGDLPLIDKEILKKIMLNHDKKKIWTSFVVTKKFIESKNLNAEYPIIVDGVPCYYTGIYLVNSREINNLELVQEKCIILDDERVAVNINTKKDYDLLCIT